MAHFSSGGRKGKQARPFYYSFKSRIIEGAILWDKSVHMKRFEIYANDVLVGSSSLESGDPPMGVAFGNLLTTPSFHTDLIDRGVLTVMLDGVSIPSSGGVVIEDYSKEANEILVAILGIDHQLYEELFPEHVAAYQAQF
ncbi:MULTISPECIES: hypothetical protein [Brucella/Ochrobactrum group]|jgi:hypothetical protein|uniref:Uncharacterized protein n=2 Tax=Brucella pseudintermedia TaxID=370111 RepID=A0ABY5U9C1_9HYPH|nr:MULTISPECIES: hypothetical protein [Brucella/Ochrobactrum group]NKE75940.1 hypothetical protein [Ochrobactrum sp. MC-1LL]UWL59931.1 hypothetical protein NIK97_10465 [Brucella pseudintermedia]WPM80352.1 hypothetical protein R5W60_01095 [Brucella pseudintermedia]